VLDGVSKAAQNSWPILWSRSPRTSPSGPRPAWAGRARFILAAPGRRAQNRGVTPAP